MTAPDALPPPVLEAKNLALSRGGRSLFSGIDITLRPAAIHYLRGPNGAGKTSLLLTLAGVLRPDSGTVRYRDKGEDAPREPHMHLCLPLSGMKPRLTAGENLRFWRALYGATGMAAEDALARVGLGGLEMIPAGHLSTGQLRRLTLARLLVSQRVVWLLDEPTSALDAEGEALVAALIGAHCAAGGMAVVATHHAIEARTPGVVETTLLGAPA